jgi:hypothetical protein
LKSHIFVDITDLDYNNLVHVTYKAVILLSDPDRVIGFNWDDLYLCAESSGELVELFASKVLTYVSGYLI